MRHRRRALLTSALLAIGCANNHPTERLATTAAITSNWETPFTRTQGWTGADGAATIPLPNHKAVWLFGDTWIGPVINGRHAEGTTMVNNTIAICAAATDPPAPDNIRFVWGDAAGKPAAWAIPHQSDQWFWPAGGGIVAPGPDHADRLLIFMTRLSHIDSGNTDSIWNFQARGSTLLSVSNPADDPERWQPVQMTINSLDAKADQRIITWGAAVANAARATASNSSTSDLLIYGIDATTNLDKKLLLARAPAATIERLDTWRFRTASSWSNKELDSSPVAANLASELSIHYLKLDRAETWVMVYSEPPMGTGILARTAAAPEGPWSTPIHLYTCPEPAVDKRLFVYAAKAHPELSEPGELLISYCVNSLDFWDVAAHADKYRPRFVRVPLAAIK